MNELAARARRGELLDDVLIIDFHVHYASKWNGMNIVVDDNDEMIRLAELSSVDRLVVNGCLLPDLGPANDRVAALAARRPERVIGFASTNPYQHDMVAEVRRCLEELGMLGVKLHSMHDRYTTPRPIASYTKEWDALFEYLSERRAPVLYHGVVTEKMIADWPQVPFVCAHGLSSVETMDSLARYANFHVDTAWTQNPAWAVTRAVDILGSERVLWGTDAPLVDFSHRLGVVLDADLTETQMRQVLGLNAARLMGLPVTPSALT